jgi:arylsulfatase A-like enzyme
MQMVELEPAALLPGSWTLAAGSGGVRVFNAGMHGAKGTAYMGGTRVPAFFRWKGTLKPRDVDKLTAHIDYFPTFAPIAILNIHYANCSSGKVVIGIG